MDVDATNNKMITVKGIEPFNLLLDAIRQKDIRSAEALIKKCNFQEHSDLGMTEAIRNNDLKMVEMLIKYGAELNKKACHIDPHVDKFSGCLLSLAAGTSLKMVKLLLKHGADINRPSHILEKVLEMKDNKMLRFLLKAGADFNLQPSPGEETSNDYGFPLCSAAGSGNIEGVKILINHIRKKPQEERTIMLSQAITKAAVGRYLDIVSLLLKEGADPNYANKSGSTLRRILEYLDSRFKSIDIQNHLRERKVEILKLLLKHGASFSEDEKINNIEANTWLAAATDAAYDVDFQAFKFFYEQGNINLFQIPLREENILVCAVKAGNFEMTQFLLEQGAMPLAKYAKGLPITLYATDQEDSRIVQKLLEHGADFKKAYEADNQILFKLIDNNRVDILRLLPQYWPEFYKQHYVLKEIRSISSELRSYAKDSKLTLMDIGDLKPIRSLPPLLYALDRCKIEVAEFLLSVGADPDTRAECGMIGLIECIKAQYIEGINLLFKYEANVNIRDDSENTPLIWAVFIGLKNVVVALLRAGAKINCNKHCEDPISLSHKMGFDAIGKLLAEWRWCTSYYTFYNHPVALGTNKSLRDGDVMPFPLNFGMEYLEEQADKDK